MENKELFKKLNLYKYASVDLETTGLSHDDNRITEVGIAIVENGEITEKYSWLVNPEQQIPDNIVKLTGISQEMVEGKPTFTEISDEVLKILENVPIVGQNVIFDVNFLEASFRRKHKNFRAWQKRYKEYHYITNTYFDTAYLSRLIFPFFPKFNLSAIAEQFGYKPDVAHRALDDAITASNVFNILLQKAYSLSIEELQELLVLLEKNKSPLPGIFNTILQEKVSTAFDQADYDWSHATFEQANIIGKIPEQILMPKEETTTKAINKDEVVDIFKEGGLLQQKLENFESRDEQIDMVDKVIDSFNNGQIVSVEAGTGTGKSLAYLIPAIHWAVKNRERGARIVISTNTKNLQEQLFYKDIPFLKATLGLDFSAVLLKGKSNYLCLDRWEHVMQNPSQRLSEHDKVTVGGLIHWKSLTQTGDIANHHGFRLESNMGLWMNFVAEDKYCPGKKCSLYNNCYLMKIRNAARVADVVVVNHALLCSDIAAENSILGPYDFLIVDEAHNLEKTAIDYLGYEAVFWEIKNVLDNIFESNKNLGILVQMENSIKFADKIDVEKKKAILSVIETLQKDTPKTLTEVRKFFTKFNNYIQNIYSSPNEPDTAISKRIKPEDDVQKHLMKLYDNLRNEITGFAAKLYEISESFRLLEDSKLSKRTQIMQDISAKLNRLQYFIQSLDFISSVETNDYVYWFDSNPKNKEYDIRLFAVPLKIDQMLHDRLFANLEAGILTSATMTVDKSFDYFNNKLGVNLLEDERRDSLKLHSPFDYNKQVLIAAPSHFPLPNSREFNERIKVMAKDFISTINRGTLMLFTSYYMLKDVYYDAKQTFSSKGILAMAQGIDGSRINIIRQFKDEHNSVLFGTNSFWEGVDVPGKSLEMLVITKLPFEVPSDPVVEARFELLEAEGKNPFMEYMLPEAIIKLKQGMGRLIRSKSDYGVVLIADPRIITKAYSRIIRNSLPVKIQSFSDDESMFSHIKTWFKNFEINDKVENNTDEVSYD